MISNDTIARVDGIAKLGHSAICPSLVTLPRLCFGLGALLLLFLYVAVEAAFGLLI